ncbi:hypothetical protein SeLEV6574_g07724 [Synchytrium endobioticum]|uniref:Uncharacterized protein n=1 Tax=Synchytrium endobioticum TaxID=286115 RepID=A0A507CG48_9FUNG|nr:hypothetical protein SeLEV6574_g07724 [Synchytrium endobioticum]
MTYYNRKADKVQKMMVAKQNCTIKNHNEQIKLASLINGLGESLDHFKTHTFATVADITYSSLFETLCQEESRRSRVHSGQDGSVYRAQYNDRSSTDESVDEGFSADRNGSRGRFTGRMGRGRYRGGSAVRGFAPGMGRGTTSRYSS